MMKDYRGNRDHAGSFRDAFSTVGAFAVEGWAYCGKSGR
jgi:hypothetical protein